MCKGITYCGFITPMTRQRGKGETTLTPVIHERKEEFIHNIHHSHDYARDWLVWVCHGCDEPKALWNLYAIFDNACEVTLGVLFWHSAFVTAMMKVVIAL